MINEKELPWCNLVAVHMDSCLVMKGSKNPFEIKLRESFASALIDMDGDSCHHIRRACKKFTKIFDEYLEQLYQDIYNDFKLSEDIRVILEDIFECLCVTYRRPEMFVATRWLSVYDVTLRTIYVCYFLFLIFKKGR